MLLYGNVIGDTGLIEASRNGYTDIVKYLVEKGADVNAKNNKNKTALDYAIKREYTEVIKILRNAGATE